MKTKVLILNPPSPDDSYINRDQMGGFGQKINFGTEKKSRLLSKLKGKFIHLPVMQLAYIATILEKKYNMEVLDALNDGLNLEQILLNVERFQPDYVFMATSSSGILFEKNVVANKIKEIMPKIKIITVGDMIPNALHLMGQPIDIAIVGESERIVEKICSGVNLRYINGIIYTKNDKIKINKRNKFLNQVELEKLPFPKWDLFNYSKFTYYPMMLVKPIAVILASRGCPYDCSYCAYTKNMGRKWRARSAKNVVDEIEHNVKDYGFKGFFFRDPLFSLDSKRTDDICNEILKRKLKIQFVFETRPELLTKSMINNLKNAGCKGINLGIEDIHPRTLKNIGRTPINLDFIKEIVNYTEKKDIRTTCFFILGIPGTTKKLLDETIQFSFKLNPSHAEYKILTPYPGTKLYNLAKKKDWLKNESYERMGGYSSMLTNKEFTPEYLEQLSSTAFKNFYFRISYFMREMRRGSIFQKMRIILKNLK